MSTARTIRTPDETRALVRAADLVQEEKHSMGRRAGASGDEGDFESRSAYLWAAQSLQRVEDKLRTEAKPLKAHGCAAPRTCDFQPEDNSLDAAPMAFGPRCGEPASFTTCDPCGGTVCVAHKCRCSKPLR